MARKAYIMCFSKGIQDRFGVSRGRFRHKVLESFLLAEA